MVGGGEAAINNFEMTPKGAHDRGAERDLKKKERKKPFHLAWFFPGDISRERVGKRRMYVGL